MREKKKIQCGIEKNGRKAYKMAKERNKAFILLGNSIYNISSDGSKVQLETLPTTRVKAKIKKYKIS